MSTIKNVKIVVDLLLIRHRKMARPTTDRRSTVTLNEFSQSEMEKLSELMDIPVASLINRAVDEWLMSDNFERLLERAKKSKLESTQE